LPCAFEPPQTPSEGTTTLRGEGIAQVPSCRCPVALRASKPRTEHTSARARGKSDPIDALAVARAALVLLAEAARKLESTGHRNSSRAGLARLHDLSRSDHGRR